MNVSVEETGPVERCLRIEIPTTEVDAAFEAAFRAIRRSTQIRGFRPGKAPREVLEQQFGEQASGEVLQRLVEGTLFKAIEESQLDVLGERVATVQRHHRQPGFRGAVARFHAGDAVVEQHRHAVAPAHAEPGERAGQANGLLVVITIGDDFFAAVQERPLAASPRLRRRKTPECTHPAPSAADTSAAEPLRCRIF